MIQVRKSEERGRAKADWLDSYHTFSFADYFDPHHMHFRHLRVINEDRIQPAKGFPAHSHRDMEILTYVLEGALEHQDSMGNGSIIRRGDIQRMSAGTGITHSEQNASAKEWVHLLQIWILPEKAGTHPGYEQAHFRDETKKNHFYLIASRTPRGGAIKIHQDAELFAAILDQGTSVTQALSDQRYAWLQLAAGTVELNGILLQAGDGAAASGEKELRITAKKDSEILLFDLA